MGCIYKIHLFAINRVGKFEKSAADSPCYLENEKTCNYESKINEKIVVENPPKCKNLKQSKFSDTPFCHVTAAWYYHGTDMKPLLLPWYYHGIFGLLLQYHGTTMVLPWYHYRYHGTVGLLIMFHGSTMVALPLPWYYHGTAAHVPW